MSTEPIIGLSITAAPIQDTSQPCAGDRHQFRMGMLSFIYFTPKVARQWVDVLETIAEGK